MEILLTLDYELFNGRRSGTVENCLLKPMEALCMVLDKHGFKATLFVDTVFINRLKQLGELYPELQSEYDKIVRQLKNLHLQGHDLQLHIHPNWLHATYENGDWQSVLADFKLSDMTDEEVNQMFEEGVSFLEFIKGEKGSVVAFRAGAYCIQTYPRYNQVFKKYGIKVDSSVLRCSKSISEKYQLYDYSNVPQDYSYRIESDVTKKDDNGSFWEVSIPTYSLKRKEYFFMKKEIRGNMHALKKWGDGQPGLTALEGYFKRLYVAINTRLFPPRIVASIDSTSGFFLRRIYEIEMKSNNYMLIMGHPKNFTPYSIKCLDKLLSELSEVHNTTIREFMNR